ncbi:MAG: hypothetical protein KIC94_01325 [Clostridiales bacterium]|nr:hypothetical protein [Clostridiales bacterium]
MGDIFHRATLIKGVTIKKKEKNRKRNVILNFRVTEEEKRLINNRIELSGMAKADYLIKSCLHQEIVTYGNVKTFDVIKSRLKIIDRHLLSIQKAEELDLEILESLRTILDILAGLEKEGGINE